ncbi:hypothetical protein ACFE04_010423 [Oxalis oulophora]
MASITHTRIASKSTLCLDNEEEPSLGNVIYLVKEKKHHPEPEKQTIAYLVNIIDMRISADGRKVKPSRKFYSREEKDYMNFRAQLITSPPQHYRYTNVLIPHSSSNSKQKEYKEELAKTIQAFVRARKTREQFSVFIDVVDNFFPGDVLLLNKGYDELDRCSICLRHFEEHAERLIKTPCSHIFHGYCVLNWFGFHDSCPICRHQFALTF